MDCIIIGIAGGTGSGKSTFTNRLRDRFGDNITVIYHDNYYKRHDDIPFEERKKLNYDHPDALETDLLIEHIKRLRNGESIECPVYDYTVHNRSDKTVRIDPRKIILIEGILLLADPRLRSLLDIKIYVEADADERILRRILRDVKERGRDIDNIVEQYLTTVKPMHYLYVEPTRATADIVINSGMNDVAFDIVQSKIRLMLEEGKKLCAEAGNTVRFHRQINKKGVACQINDGQRLFNRIKQVTVRLSASRKVDYKYPLDFSICVITVCWKRSGHSAFLRIPDRSHILPESVRKQPPEHPPV